MSQPLTFTVTEWDDETLTAETVAELVALPTKDAKTKAVSHANRNAARSGRAAFAGNICALHPGNDDNPCAKFGHLPGKGKGEYQPPVVRVILSVFTDLIKPLAILGVAGIAFLLLSNVVSGNILQSGDSVSTATCTMPDGSVVSAVDNLHRRNIDGTCRAYRGPGGVLGPTDLDQ